MTRPICVPQGTCIPLRHLVWVRKMKGMEDLAILGLFNCFFVYFEAILEAADAT